MCSWWLLLAGSTHILMPVAIRGDKATCIHLENTFGAMKMLKGKSTKINQFCGCIALTSSTIHSIWTWSVFRKNFQPSQIWHWTGTSVLCHCHQDLGIWYSLCPMTDPNSHPIIPCQHCHHYAVRLWSSQILLSWNGLCQGNEHADVAQAGLPKDSDMYCISPVTVSTHLAVCRLWGQSNPNVEKQTKCCWLAWIKLKITGSAINSVWYIKGVPVLQY